MCKAEAIALSQCGMCALLVSRDLPFSLTSVIGDKTILQRIAMKVTQGVLSAQQALGSLGECPPHHP
jgi:hypothetical protein